MNPKKFLFSFFSIISIIGYGVFVFAAAPSGGYTPGQILDPDCAPGDVDCVVTLPTGGSVTADNGLTATSGNVQLGGLLTQNTTVSQDGYDFLVQDGENSLGLMHFTGGIISGVMHYEPGVERYGISYLELSGSKSINLSYSSEVSLKTHGFTINNDLVTMSSRSSSASSENFWTSIYIESSQQEIKMTGSNDLNTGNTVWQNTALSDPDGDTHAELARIRNDGSWQWSFYPNTRDDSSTASPVNFLYTDISGNIFSAPKELILGNGTSSPSFSEYVIGSYNTVYTPASPFIWNPVDRLFTVGNGAVSGLESDAFTILKNGETGIGIDNFETNTNGNIFQVGDGTTNIIGYVDDITGNWVAVSDERKKDNIEDLSYGLPELIKLRPTSFNYKRNGEHTIGFIAQEVLPVIPEAVYGTELEGYGMSYATLTPVIVKAIQEMNLNVIELTNTERPNVWRDSIIAWMGDVENGINELYVKVFHADRVETKELCIEDVCVTKDQLQQVLNNNQIELVSPIDISGNNTPTDTSEIITDTSTILETDLDTTGVTEENISNGDSIDQVTADDPSDTQSTDTQSEINTIETI